MGRARVTSAQELARCAARIVERDGLAQVAARTVADEAGIAVGTLYRHVRDLPELLTIAARQVEADFVADLRRAAPPDVPLRPALPAVAHAVLARARVAPRLMELLALPATTANGTDGAGVRAWIADRVRHATWVRDIGPCDPDLVAAAGYGLVRGVLEVVTFGGDQARAEEIVAVGLAALLPHP